MNDEFSYTIVVVGFNNLDFGQDEFALVEGTIEDEGFEFTTLPAHVELVLVVESLKESRVIEGSQGLVQVFARNESRWTSRLDQDSVKATVLQHALEQIVLSSCSPCSYTSVVLMLLPWRQCRINGTPRHSWTRVENT